MQGFFCDLQLHGQTADHPLQLSDAGLILGPVLVGGEEGGRALQKLGFPAQDDLLFEVIFAADLGRALEAREDLQDDLGFEVRGEPASLILW